MTPEQQWAVAAGERGWLLALYRAVYARELLYELGRFWSLFERASVARQAGVRGRASALVIPTTATEGASS